MQRTTTLSIQNWMRRQQQQTIFGAQQTAERLSLIEHRLDQTGHGRRITGEISQGDRSTQVAVIGAGIQQAPGAVEQQAYVDLGVFLQLAKVTQIGLDKGRIRLLGEGVGIVPDRPVSGQCR